MVSVTCCFYTLFCILFLLLVYTKIVIFAYYLFSVFIKQTYKPAYEKYPRLNYCLISKSHSFSVFCDIKRSYCYWATSFIGGMRWRGLFHKHIDRYGWGTWIRTRECQDQNLVPYRLAIPQLDLKMNGGYDGNRTCDPSIMSAVL